MKCKGCTGEINYRSLQEVRERFPKQFHNAGPALTHSLPHCEWFEKTPASQIVAYINVATYKAKQSESPRLFE